MTLTQKAAWRSPALGQPRELKLQDCTLRCWEAGRGEPLVLVHGVLLNANVWRKVVPRLAPDFRCIALDLPMGSHAQPMPSADRSAAGLARMVVGALDALGLERATLVANDTGGVICQIVVAEYPDRVERVVLSDCEFGDHCPPRMFRHLKPLGRIPGGLLAYLAPGHLRPLLRLPVSYGWLAKRPFEPEAADSYARPSVQSRAIRDDFRAFLRGYGRRDTAGALRRLRHFDRPVLIAWAREDRVMPPEDAEQLARVFPNARLEWIDDSYTITPEDRPDQLADLIGGFVREPLAVV